jgi:hypothetical protein
MNLVHILDRLGNAPAISSVGVIMVGHEFPWVHKIEFLRPHNTEHLRREVTFPYTHLGTYRMLGEALEDNVTRIMTPWSIYQCRAPAADVLLFGIYTGFPTIIPAYAQCRAIRGLHYHLEHFTLSAAFTCAARNQCSRA